MAKDRTPVSGRGGNAGRSGPTAKGRTRPVPNVVTPQRPWGLIVASGLVIGSMPLFLGLIIVMPVLGHATWHLYRKVVPR